MTNKNCPKCKGTGKVQDPNGTIHTCWDCLNAGEMDEHDKTFKDHGLRV